ncbi:hypothetical protein ABEY43_06085 [Priestia megaterium]
MKVKKTLHQVFEEIKELREHKDLTARMVASSLIREDGHHNSLVEEYKHYDELLRYLSKIEVEYEDKYETEEIED